MLCVWSVIYVDAVSPAVTTGAVHRALHPMSLPGGSAVSHRMVEGRITRRSPDRSRLHSPGSPVGQNEFRWWTELISGFPDWYLRPVMRPSRGVNLRGI